MVMDCELLGWNVWNYLGSYKKILWQKGRGGGGLKIQIFRRRHLWTIPQYTIFFALIFKVKSIYKIYLRKISKVYSKVPAWKAAKSKIISQLSNRNVNTRSVGIEGGGWTNFKVTWKCFRIFFCKISLQSQQRSFKRLKVAL